MQGIWILFAVFVTATLGTFFKSLSFFIMLGSFVALGYMLWKQKEKGFKPQSTTYKEIEKLKKKRLKSDNDKHKYISDQVAYIAEIWGYTKEQEKIITKFIEGRVYTEMYNKWTASLFPQIITIIEKCNAKGQKGCKRDVARRLRELTTLMKEELKKQKSQHIENLETTLEVYDQLVKEVK